MSELESLLWTIVVYGLLLGILISMTSQLWGKKKSPLCVLAYFVNLLRRAIAGILREAARIVAPGGGKK